MRWFVCSKQRAKRNLEQILQLMKRLHLFSSVSTRWLSFEQKQSVQSDGGPPKKKMPDRRNEN
jgi:hypothetical protein